MLTGEALRRWAAASHSSQGGRVGGRSSSSGVDDQSADVGDGEGGDDRQGDDHQTERRGLAVSTSPATDGCGCR